MSYPSLSIFDKNMSNINDLLLKTVLLSEAKKCITIKR